MTMQDDQDHRSDQRITDAYERLGIALSPPPDVIVLVERELGARRRRRRTAVVGAAALVLGGAVGGAVVLRPRDGHDRRQVATDSPTNTQTVPPAEHSGSFTIIKPDGSQVVVDDLRLSCEQTPEGRPAEPGHLYLWSPVHLAASQDRLAKPYVSFDAVVRRADGKDYALPVGITADSGSPDVLLYATEADDGTHQQPNEVSSFEGGATGTIRVLHASCAPTPQLAIEVDTTLGSEVHQGTLEVIGAYH